MSKIIQKEDPVLRLIAREVTLNEIGGEKINKIIEEMTATLEKSSDGVALAAPQIGESIRLFVVSPRAYEIQAGEEANRSSDIDAEKKPTATVDKLIYINPIITRRSSKKIELDEGCLSVRNVFGKIFRHEKVTVTALDEHGKKFSRGASGLLAEIYQHEIDHLNGILFIDSAKDLIINAHHHQDGTK